MQMALHTPSSNRQDPYLQFLQSEPSVITISENVKVTTGSAVGLLRISWLFQLRLKIKPNWLAKKMKTKRTKAKKTIMTCLLIWHLTANNSVREVD